MEISNTHFLHGVQGLNGPHRNTAIKNAPNTGSSNTAIQDEVHFSEAAQRFSETERSESSASGIRFELVNRIKAEIASGNYDTPDKMDVAMDRLLSQLNPR